MPFAHIYIFSNKFFSRADLSKAIFKHFCHIFWGFAKMVNFKYLLPFLSIINLCQEILVLARTQYAGEGDTVTLQGCWVVPRTPARMSAFLDAAFFYCFFCSLFFWPLFFDCFFCSLFFWTLFFNSCVFMAATFFWCIFPFLAARPAQYLPITSISRFHWTSL